MRKHCVAIIFLIGVCCTGAFAKEANAIAFLTLADIHFDPFASCQPAKPCPLIAKLRDAPSSQWQRMLTANASAPPAIHQDTNIGLLDSTLTAAKQVATHQQVKFVLVLGDFLRHDFRRQYKHYTHDKTHAGYQVFVRKTMEFLADQLAAAFPTQDIYVVMGNNDSYYGNYVVKSKGTFFSDGARIWSHLVKPASAQQALISTFPTAGYYALNLPQASNTRLIVLNTTLFSYKALGDVMGQAAKQELAWFHEQLVAAKAHHQRVLIAMHIPLDVDVLASWHLRLFAILELWKQTYARQFQAELESFIPQIAGMFAGHIHSDWTRTITFHQTEDILFSGTPSVSPIYGNDPGFKTYTYSSQSGRLISMSAYDYPLNDEKGWQVQYEQAL